MNTTAFAPLTNHSEYSMLDGVQSIEAMVARMAALGFSHGALTDHANMYGAVKFTKACKKAGVKPILGYDAYVSVGSHLDKNQDNKRLHQLVLLALNDVGYHNLIKLASIAATDGFYYKPRISKDLLAQHHEGLVALSGCLNGEIATMLVDDDRIGARKVAQEYQAIFGDRFFIEVQNHGLVNQAKILPLQQQIAEKLGISIVATNNSHYTVAAEAETQEVLWAISFNKRLSDPQRVTPGHAAAYIKSAEEMLALYPDHPEYLTASQDIADRVDFTLELGKHHFPVFELPAGVTPEQQVLKNAIAGFKERCATHLDDQIYRARMKYELEVIHRLGFDTYFLVVQDFIMWAKDHAIPVGPGRGSVAGSLVAYCLKITDVDPIPYGLIFERFLNESRISLPDIDVDFAPDGRDRVIEYVSNKYGHEKVGHIVTFNQMKARSAIRDTGRVLGVPKLAVDKAAKLIPWGNKLTIEQATAQVDDLRTFMGQHKSIQQLMKTAQRIEGKARNTGVHAAGIVIAPQNLSAMVPVQQVKNSDKVAVQYDMNDIEEMGLVKMDFLGLRTLTYIRDTVKLIRARHKKHIDINAIPLDDAAVFRLLSTGYTMGIFQLEGTGMRQLLTQMQPSELNDIFACISLYRPGPMGTNMHNVYVQRKHGLLETEYAHPVLEPILRDTYGIITYQEQIMFTLTDLGNFDMVTADNIRKIIGKKRDMKEIEAYRQQFVDGAFALHGADPEITNKVFDEMVEFAGYGFNKCVAGTERMFRHGQTKDTNHPTIAEMYYTRNNARYAKLHDKQALRKKYNRYGYGKTRSMRADGRLINNNIVDIRHAGFDTIYRVVLEDGRAIRCTLNHKFPTQRGEIPLSEINIGDYLYVNNGYEKSDNTFRYNRYGINFPQKGEQGFQKLTEAVSQIALAHRQIILEMSDGRCSSCKQTTGLCGRLEAHHIDGDHGNNVMENLSAVCSGCHKLAHYKMGRVKAGTKGIPTHMTPIVSIIKESIEEVFDVEMAHPMHTWETSEGIVTCNSHAAAYGIIGYQTAYLKTHYPQEFYACYLSSEMDDHEKLALVHAEMRERGFTMLSPDVNASDAMFSIDGPSIRYGLAAIKGVGEKAVANIVEERTQAPYADIADFLMRCDFRKVNKSVSESLIKAGAMDAFDGSRIQKIEGYDEARKVVRKRRELEKKREAQLAAGQTELFDAATMELKPVPVKLPRARKQPKRVILKAEREVTGIYLSEHPIEEYIGVLKGVISHKIAELGPRNDGRTVRVAGVVQGYERRLSKKGNYYGVFSVQDLTGSLDVLIFNGREKTLDNNLPYLKNDAVLVVQGEVKFEEDMLSSDDTTPRGSLKMFCELVFPVEHLTSTKTTP